MLTDDKEYDANSIISPYLWTGLSSTQFQTYVLISAQLWLNTAGCNMGWGGKTFDVNRKLQGVRANEPQPWRCFEIWTKY